MKKLLVLVSALLVLAGCANKEASPSTNDVLITVGKNKITQNQLFHTMKASDAGSLAIEKGQNIITKDITDEEIADQVAELLQKQKDDLKDDFLESIQSLGFETEEEYVEKNLKPYVRMKVYLEKTMSEDYERLAIELMPRKIAVLEIKGKDKADEAKKLLSDVASISSIAKQLDQDVDLDGTETLEFMVTAQLPSIVSTFVKENNKPITSEVLETTEAEIKYYIVSVISADVLELKDEAIELALSNNKVTQAELAKIYKSKGFKIYDETIYKALKKSHGSYLAN